MSDSRGPAAMEINYLKDSLAMQNLLLQKLSDQVSDLKEVPKQIAVIESKLDSLNSIDAKVHSVGSATDKHATLLRLLGCVTGVLFPMVIAWTISIRTELTALQINFTEVNAVVRTMEKHNAQVSVKKN